MEIVKDHIAVFENLVSSELCDNIVSWFEKHDEKVISDPALLTHYNENLKRDSQAYYQPTWRTKDVAYFMERDHDADEYAIQLKDILVSAVKEYMIEYPNLSEYKLFNNELKIQKTQKHGGYHVWHHEHGYSSTSPYRIITWSVYLSDLPEGEGETEFLYQGIKVPCKKGLVCLFPAGFTHLHRGNPPYSDDKYIATGWFLTDYEK